MLLVTTFYLIRVSHTWNPSAPPFPSGCLTPGILPHRHFHSTVLHPESLLCCHFYPSVSHPESFCAVISIRVSHVRNPIHRRSTFPRCLTPAVVSAVIPSGCKASEILSADVPPSPGVSRPESYPPTIHLPRVSHTRSPLRCHSIRMPRIRNPIRRCSTFPG